MQKTRENLGFELVSPSQTMNSVSTIKASWLPEVDGTASASERRVENKQRHPADNSQMETVRALAEVVRDKETRKSGDSIYPNAT